MTHPRVRTPLSKRARRLAAFGLVAFFTVAYFAFSPAFGRSLYYLVLFRPSVYPGGFYDHTEVAGVKAEDVYFKTADGAKLHGWYFNKPGAKHLVLMHHGQGGNLAILQVYIDAALRSNASMMVYDYRGYGRSEGKPSIAGICEDAEAALNFVTTNKRWTPNKVIDLGLSMGTGPASELALKHDFAAVILVAPFTTLRTACRDVLPFLKVYPDPLWPDRDIGPKYLVDKPKHPPILLLHGEDDSYLPIRYSEQLSKIGSQPLQLVRLNGGHGNIAKAGSPMFDRINEFVAKLDASATGKSDLRFGQVTP